MKKPIGQGAKNRNFEAACLSQFTDQGERACGMPESMRSNKARNFQ